jgi:small redox-active disulfide protein 2
MTNEDVIQLKIGSFQIGIIGLKEVLAELDSSMAEASDEQVATELLHRLSKKNFFPEKAKAEYARALVREFRKHLGQEIPPAQEEQGLVIKVLGQGCANCRALSQRVMEVLTELRLAADFEHVTDIKEIAQYGILQSPALVINGKIVALGRVPTKTQLIEFFKKVGG